jgi:hypothetical protein
MVRLLCRFGLWLIGVAIPVFIAACYGAPYRFSKSGKVTDRKTGAGVEGIELICMSGGQELSSTYTSTNGNYYLYYDQSCDTLEVVDTDGAAHGSYQTSTEPFCESCTSIDVELDAK